jgi:glycosyltransferase involved in cell wall biosynthesis
LRAMARQERPDVIHVWDWSQCLDAFYSVHLAMGIPLVVSDMCMSVSRILPESLLTTFGTPELVDVARAAGRPRVELLLPPVDIVRNAYGCVDAEMFRTRYGIAAADILLLTVSRLDGHLKAESLRRTMDAVRALGQALPLRFVLVGDGALREELEQRARTINDELRRPAVLLTGALFDPRPAYAAADLVVGMGGSALRAMAFAKPVVIVGKDGFAATFSPETEETFYHRGMYGIGQGDPQNVVLRREICDLIERHNRVATLGQFSRQFVVKHFSLETVSARLSGLCAAAVTQAPNLPAAVADGVRTAAVWLRERRFIPQERAFLARLEDTKTAV